jgi:ankyrin repeat protein
MHNKIIVLAAGIFGVLCASEPVAIKFPQDIKAYIISFIKESTKTRTLRTFKNLNLINKEWNQTLADPYIFKQLVIQLVDQEGKLDEQWIRKEMGNMKGYESEVVQNWLKQLIQQRYQLIEAIEKDDGQTVAEILNQNKILMYKELSGGEYPIKRALNKSKQSVLKVLLNFNGRDFNHKLQQVLKSVSHRNVSFICEFFAKIAAADSAHDTEWEQIFKNLNIFKELVACIAKKSGNYDVVLIANRLITSSKTQHPEILQWLIALKEQSVQEKLLFQAVKDDNSQQIEKLVTEQKVNINARDAYNSTPLFKAASGDKFNAVQTLLKLQAAVDLPDMHDGSPLKRAASKNHLNIVKALLAAGADPNRADAEDFTGLMNAAEGGNYGVCEALIAAGAQLNLQERYGATALMHAVERKNFNLTELLLKNGAYPHIRDYHGQSAFSIAKMNGDALMINLLQKYKSASQNK